MKPTLETLALIALATPALAEPCRDLSHDGTSYTICEVTTPADLRLWWQAPDGLPVATFERLQAGLAPGETIAFAMNAGMYHPDRRPVGLYVENGTQAAPIVTREGPGNFGLLPNGVFCIANRFAVIESRAYAATAPECRFATQSGPMLVIDGALHPRFVPDSDSLNTRNGVGVSADGDTAWFAISNAPVTFHAFARLFRDELGAANALYLDGSVSRLFAPGLGRADTGAPMGPIVGLVAQAR
ncbi:hypothetical protein EOM89_01370 [Candidatus Falkowbacteria bacterium]|nr:hypothetical protein [Candidatus Falkowbacteria bacterium]